MGIGNGEKGGWLVSDEYGSFEDLECWKACRILRKFVMQKIVPLLPREERYWMGDNLIRAARSTTRNIAEAFGRYHYMDKVKFCGYSRGSSWEVLDDLITCHDDGLISDELLKEGRQHVSTAVKITNGYIRYLRRAAKSSQNNKAKEPRPRLGGPWGYKDSPSEFDDEEPEQDHPS